MAASILSYGADVFVTLAGFVEGLWLLMTRSVHLFLAIVEVSIWTVISISGVISSVLKTLVSVIGLLFLWIKEGLFLTFGVMHKILGGTVFPFVTETLPLLWNTAVNVLLLFCSYISRQCVFIAEVTPGIFRAVTDIVWTFFVRTTEVVLQTYDVIHKVFNGRVLPFVTDTLPLVWNATASGLFTGLSYTSSATVFLFRCLTQAIGYTYDISIAIISYMWYMLVMVFQQAFRLTISASEYGLLSLQHLGKATLDLWTIVSAYMALLLKYFAITLSLFYHWALSFVTETLPWIIHQVMSYHRLIFGFIVVCVLVIAATCILYILFATLKLLYNRVTTYISKVHNFLANLSEIFNQRRDLPRERERQQDEQRAVPRPAPANEGAREEVSTATSNVVRHRTSINCRGTEGRERTPIHHARHTSADEDRNLCIVCYSNEKCMLIRPCNHLCLCEECSDNMRHHQDCPLCRRAIANIERVYL